MSVGILHASDRFAEFVRYLVVSSDTYDAAFGDRRLIAVEVDSRAIYPRYPAGPR